MKKLFILLFAFVIPYIIVYWFSKRIDPYIGSILIGIIGIPIIIYTLYIATNNKYMKLFITILLACTLFTNLVNAICYYKMNMPINFIFLQHFSFISLKIASASEIIYLISLLLLMMGCIVAFIMIDSSDDVKKTKMPIKIILLLIGCSCTYIYSNSVKDVFNLLKKSCFHDKMKVCDDKTLNENGIKTTNVDYTGLIASKGKNLVFIYLESFESIFTDDKRFPELTPNINELKKEAVVFNNVIPAQCSNYSLGGLYSSISGSHFVTEHYTSSFFKIGAFINCNIGNQLLTVPKILKKLQYKQIFITNTLFPLGDMDMIVENEKYDEAITVKGHDDNLFEVSYNKIVETSKNNKSFSVTLFTADTHEPGAPDKSWETYKHDGEWCLKQDGRILTSIKHTDDSIGKFINKLKQLPVWKDTIVFMMSDHLARNIDENIIPEQERRLLVFALNTGYRDTVKTSGKTFDIAPTLLDSMDIKHNYTFPLGESLLNNNHDSNRLNDNTVLHEDLLTFYIKEKTKLD